MSNYIKLVQSQTELTSFKTSNDFITPSLLAVHNSRIADYNPYISPHDYSQDYLTFVAEEDGTFKFTGNSINYSVDDGDTWTTLSANTNTPTINVGEKIMWKAELTPETNKGVGTFSSTGRFTAQGNVMSLLYGDNFIGQTSLSGKDYAFKNLFNGCTGMTSAENVSLPATILTAACYSTMFYGCTSLTTAPELPATTLAYNCYSAMFSSCTSLTTAPELPATTLNQSCYASMFSCCDSLTTAPELPATTLAGYCYYCMFRGCTSLTAAPELPAITLVNNCYNFMFYDCTSLNSIICLATDISASNCTDNWVSGIVTSGTFTKADSMTRWTTGNDGIPSGWTVQDAS